MNKGKIILVLILVIALSFSVSAAISEEINKDYNRNYDKWTYQEDLKGRIKGFVLLHEWNTPTYSYKADYSGSGISNIWKIYNSNNYYNSNNAVNSAFNTYQRNNWGYSKYVRNYW